VVSSLIQTKTINMKLPVVSPYGRRFKFKPNGLVTTSKAGMKCPLEERELRIEKRRFKKKNKIKKL
tara:strand:- start:562 stop:759 length:198 start_codon:yes stop_codon:yes gene_type:complete